MTYTMSRKERGGRLDCINDSAGTSIRRLEENMKWTEKDWLLQPETIQSIQGLTEQQKREEKQLYGYFGL